MGGALCPGEALCPKCVGDGIKKKLIGCPVHDEWLIIMKRSHLHNMHAGWSDTLKLYLLQNNY